MCGRYNLVTDAGALVDFFELTYAQVDLSGLRPRYNIAPTQPILACRVGPTGARELVSLRWGLIPHWAKDAKVGYTMINARVETVAEKPAYREAFNRRRCLIPATGFYEWKAQGLGKQPFHIHRRDGQLFALAGLWEQWHNLAGEPLESCTILVGPPNDVVAPVHDRMPVVLAPIHFAVWLDARTSLNAVKALLMPAPAQDWEAYPISPAVNTTRIDGPALIRPL